jgi:hypothetical protein
MTEAYVSFCVHPVPNFGNMKSTAFQGLPFQRTFIFTHFRFVFDTERKARREGKERKGGRYVGREDGRTL